MGWTKVRSSMACFAVVLFVAGSALAQDLEFASAAGNFKAGGNSPQLGGALSNSGIDRLLDINSKHHSVLGSSSDFVDSADEALLRASTPLGTVDDAPIRQGSGNLVIAGIGGALALGLGLCFASMMSGRHRTINTFTAGFVRVR